MSSEKVNNYFKAPWLIPNFKGRVPDWEDLIQNPEDWFVSIKRDGGRVECLPGGKALGRSMKPIKSLHVQRMVEDLMLATQSEYVFEAEFYSHEMNFAEIMHFFRAEDVTSDKSIKKYANLWKKTKGGTVGVYKKVEYLMKDLKPYMLDNGATIWPFPGRTVEWLTTWHDSLKLYIFDLVHDLVPKSIRDEALVQVSKVLPVDVEYVRQNTFSNLEAIYQEYDQAIIDGYEGLVLVKKSSMYKQDRATLKENVIFKMKDDGHEFDGEIMSVEQGTYTREGSERTTNELGRSVTSKLKEDRVPGGYAKGFLVRMDDGRTLTVSLRGFNQQDKEHMWNNPKEWVGQWVRFTGMQPVRIGGVPRSAFCSPGDFRDEK